mgnify:FL=1
MEFKTCGHESGIVLTTRGHWLNKWTAMTQTCSTITLGNLWQKQYDVRTSTVLLFYCKLSMLNVQKHDVNNHTRSFIHTWYYRKQNVTYSLHFINHALTLFVLLYLRTFVFHFLSYQSMCGAISFQLVRGHFCFCTIHRLCATTLNIATI